MKKKCRKLLSLLTVLCLVLSMTPLAALAAEETGTVTDAAGLKAAVANGGTVTFGGDIALTETLSITKEVVIEGNGHKLTGTVAEGTSFINVVTDGAFTMKNVVFEPSGKVTPNGFIKIAAKGVVTVTGCTFGSADAGVGEDYIYNGLEFSQDAQYAVATETAISDNTFYGASFRHNGINIYQISENAEIDLNGNDFVDMNWDTSNGIRLSNYSAAAATVNMDGNSYSEHGTDTPDSKNWAGLFIFQNASANGSGKNLKINVTNLDYQGTTEQLYVLYEKITKDTMPTVVGDVSVKDLKVVNYGTGADGTVAPAFIAETGDRCYGDLAEAIEAAEANATVTLLNDTKENVTVESGKNITLELNGKTLSGGSDNEPEHKDKPALLNNGTVVIQDSVGNGRIVREDENIQGHYVIDNQGTMTIKSGNFYNNTGIAPNGASLIRNAGEGKAATLTINGGDFEQQGFIAIKNDDQGVLGITGGTVTTAGVVGDNIFSAVQNWSQATISGGTFNGAIYTSVWSSTFDNSKTVINGENVSVNGLIVSGIAKKGDGNPYETGDKYPELIIENGKFVSDFQVGDPKMATISGGYFTSNVKDYVVEGKVAIKGTYPQDGVNYTYLVTDKPTATPEPDKIVSATAAVKTTNDSLVSGEAVAVSVGDGTLKLTGKLSSGNKAVVTYQTKDGNNTETFTVTYAEGKFTATGDNLSADKLTIGSGDTAAVYTIDLTGLELLPAQVKVAEGEADAKIDSGVTLPSNFEADKLKDTKAEGLEAAATEKIQSSAEDVTKGEVVLNNGTKINEADAIDALGDLYNPQNDEVTLVVQPYLDIQVKDYKNENGQKTLALEIEPKYNVIATTNPDNIETGDSGKNAVPMATGQKMTVKNDVTIEIPIPAELSKDTDGSLTQDLYIEHVKSDDKTYRYKATVAGNDSAGYTATFTVPNGFSKFTALVDARKGSLLFNGETLQEYTFSDIGTVLPTLPGESGKTFSGWKIEGAVYTSMTDALLTLLSNEGTPVAAEAVFTTGGGSGGGEPEEWVNPFKDVKEKDWFYDAVKYTNQKKLFGGTHADRFSPEDTMTRGMLVTVLHRLEGEPVVGTKADFSDVKQTEYYAEPVNWAAANKIVGGFDGKFNPEDAVTREEMAAILHRYASYKKYDVSATASLDSFRDGAKTSAWALGDMQWAVGAGMLYGRENNTLAPGGTATRAEVAQIMMRFCEKFVTE